MDAMLASAYLGFYPGAVCLGSPEENGGYVSEEKEQWLGLLPAVSATLRIEVRLGVSGTELITYLVL